MKFPIKKEKNETFMLIECYAIYTTPSTTWSAVGVLTISTEEVRGFQVDFLKAVQSE